MGDSGVCCWAFFRGDLGLGTLFRPEEELQAVHVVEGVDPGFFLRGFLLGFLLLGQQAQGEQVKVVQGGQAAGGLGVLGAWETPPGFGSCIYCTTMGHLLHRESSREGTGQEGTLPPPPPPGRADR